MPSTLTGEQLIGEVLYRKTFEMRVLSPGYYKFDVSYETFHAGRLVERAGGHSVGRHVRREAGFKVSAEAVAYDGSPFTRREERVVIEARRDGT